MNEEIWKAMEKDIRAKCMKSGLNEDETKRVVAQSRDYASIGIGSPLGILIRQQLKIRNAHLN